MQTPLATTTPAYSGFIKGWLWYDLMLSVVRGLLAVATLVAIGPLVRSARPEFSRSSSTPPKFGLAEFPG